MKKKTVTIWMSALVCAIMLAGCGAGKDVDTGMVSTEPEEEVVAESEPAAEELIPE